MLLRAWAARVTGTVGGGKGEGGEEQAVAQCDDSDCSLLVCMDTYDTGPARHPPMQLVETLY